MAFYLGKDVKSINKMQNRSVHLLVQSRPIDTLPYWKASELRYWLLLPSEYVHHLALLVCAMHIHLSDALHILPINSRTLSSQFVQAQFS